MQPLKNLTTIMPPGSFEVLSREKCPKCEVIVKTIKTVIIGGPRKGEPLIEKTECHCKLGKEAQAAAEKTRFKHFKKYWTVNPSIAHATLDNFEILDEEAKQASGNAWKFLTDLYKGKPARALFSGKSGQGKSHLALGVAKYAEEKLEKTTLFIELPTLKQLLQSTFNGGDLKQEDIFRAIREVDVLVLDEVGAEKGSEWIDEIFYNILNDRLGKSLFITTNLNLQELNDKYSPRHLDRILAGMAREDHLAFKGEQSYRLKQWIGEDFRK